MGNRILIGYSTVFCKNTGFYLHESTVLDERERVQYGFCRKKTSANKISWLAALILIPFFDFILSCFLCAVLTFDRNTQRTRLLLSILIHFRPTSSSKNKR